MANKSWQEKGFRDGDTVTSCIVRIYRRRDEPEVTGMVEFPDLDKNQPFHSFEELRGILGGSITSVSRRTKTRRTVENKGKAGDDN